MPDSVITFRQSGFGRIIQEWDRAKAKVQEFTRAGSKAQSAAGKAAYPAAWTSGLGGGMSSPPPAAPSAATSSANDKDYRRTVGKFAKYGQFASGLGPLGQIGEAISSAPTKGMAAVGVAAIAAGVALRQLTVVGEEMNRALTATVRTIHDTRNTLAAATSSANQSALSSVMGRREQLVGGDRGTPQLRAFFKTADTVQKQIDSAQTERALRFGEGEMRSELARIRSPDTAALLDLNKKAEEDIQIQREIRDQMNWFQKAVTFVGNGMQGRSYNADLIDAQRNQAAISSGAP